MIAIALYGRRLGRRSTARALATVLLTRTSLSQPARPRSVRRDAADCRQGRDHREADADDARREQRHRKDRIDCQRALRCRASSGRATTKTSRSRFWQTTSRLPRRPSTGSRTLPSRSWRTYTQPKIRIRPPLRSSPSARISGPARARLRGARLHPGRPRPSGAREWLLSPMRRTRPGRWRPNAGPLDPRRSAPR